MKVVIIGNGIAGITAARFIRKQSNHDITVISGESKHFFSRTALMYIYMGHMKYEHTKPYEDSFWDKNRIDLVQGWVGKIDTADKTLSMTNGDTLSYDKLVIATGSNSNKFGWSGQDLGGVQSLYSLQDLQLLEDNTKNTQHAVIVGGGLIGVELAEMLHSRNIKVTMLVREDGFFRNVFPNEEAEVINRHIREHSIDLRLNTELQEIKGQDGKVKSVITKDGEEISCQLVGLTVGVHPNIKLVKDTNIETSKGVLVDEYLETNVQDIYAIGDCAELRNAPEGRKPIEPVWYTGSIMGRCVANNICGTQENYNPGLWYNSAKFFDIEYQTYGNVPNEISENLKSIYWEHEGGKKCIRIVYDAQSNEVKGFNLLGIRYRQNVCLDWIEQKMKVDQVLSELGKANFDPEFFPRHEHELMNLKK